jgi:hypothetical protein
MRTWLTLSLVLTAGLAPASDDEPKSKKDARPQAPGDYRIFEQDKAGAYFIARPLMEKYDALRMRVAGLRAEIDGGRIDSVRARAEVAALQAELNGLLQTIDHAKLYIPGATVHKRTETTHVPIQPDDLLLVDCENVDVRGWDGPDVQCVLEKTVLDDDNGKVADDFAGIELITRKGSGKEFFGFYIDVRDLPKFKDNEDMQNELRRFVFPDFLEREFPYITVKGLVYQEGNRQIDVTVRSERGDGFSSSQWRRHATLTLLVPRCQRVGIRGGLGRLKVRDLNAGLSVLGQGNRDYNSIYEVANLGGSLAAENIPIQRIEGVKGNVSMTAMAYTENRGTGYGPDGVSFRVNDPKESVYRNIDGDLRARFCRANVTIGDVGGRVDIENDFGDTVWKADRELAQKTDHRVVSQSGSVTVCLDAKVPGSLKVELFTECGSLRRGRDVDKALNVWFEETNFQTADGDTVRRSWTSWTRRPDPQDDRPRHNWEEAFARFRRVAEALYGRPRSPGVDVISRAGTVVVALPDPGPVRYEVTPRP